MPYGPKRLTTENATEIRGLYGLGRHTQAELAARFGVSQSLVCKIINNQVHKTGLALTGSANVKVGYKYGN